MNNTIEEIDKQIESLYAEREKLKAEQREREELEKKKAAEERDKDLLDVMNTIKKFNEKHNERLVLTVKSTSDIYDNIMSAFFPWR